MLDNEKSVSFWLDIATRLSSLIHLNYNLYFFRKPTEEDLFFVNRILKCYKDHFAALKESFNCIDNMDTSDRPILEQMRSYLQRNSCEPILLVSLNANNLYINQCIFRKLQKMLERCVFPPVISGLNLKHLRDCINQKRMATLFNRVSSWMTEHAIEHDNIFFGQARVPLKEYLNLMQVGSTSWCQNDYLLEATVGLVKHIVMDEKAKQFIGGFLTSENILRLLLICLFWVIQFLSDEQKMQVKIYATLTGHTPLEIYRLEQALITIFQASESKKWWLDESETQECVEWYEEVCRQFLAELCEKNREVAAELELVKVRKPLLEKLLETYRNDSSADALKMILKLVDMEKVDSNHSHSQSILQAASSSNDAEEEERATSSCSLRY